MNKCDCTFRQKLLGGCDECSPACRRFSDEDEANEPIPYIVTDAGFAALRGES